MKMKIMWVVQVVVDENHGRKESHKGDKRSRGASRATVARLATNLVVVETFILELKERVAWKGWVLTLRN